MTEQKLTEILLALQGINLDEWKKLSLSIDNYFNDKVKKQKCNILFTDFERVALEYQHYCPAI